MIIQLLITIFALYTIIVVVINYTKKRVNNFELLFWGLLWLAVIIFVWIPGLTTDIAKKFGFEKGVTAIVQISIIMLFYLVFRLYVTIESIKCKITRLVKELALKDAKNRVNNSKSKR